LCVRQYPDSRKRRGADALPEAIEHWVAGHGDVSAFFAFQAAVRRIIYTTNAIKSLHSEVRKAVRGRGHFPSDEAATKLIWLALRNITTTWMKTPILWHAAKARFAIQFDDRFVMARGKFQRHGSHSEILAGPQWGQHHRAADR
jgi:transposase-like protein